MSPSRRGNTGGRLRLNAHPSQNPNFVGRRAKQIQVFYQRGAGSIMEAVFGKHPKHKAKTLLHVLVI